MKKMLMAAALLAAAGAGVIAAAQDVTKVAPDSYKVEFENDQIRIIRVKRGPHSKVPMHSHPDYVLMMITDIDQKVTTPDGKVVIFAGDVIMERPDHLAFHGPSAHPKSASSDADIAASVKVALKPYRDRIAMVLSAHGGPFTGDVTAALGSLLDG